MGGRVSGNAIIDFWDGGREHVPTWKVVEVLA